MLAFSRSCPVNQGRNFRRHILFYGCDLGVAVLHGETAIQGIVSPLDDIPCIIAFPLTSIRCFFLSPLFVY